MPNASIDYLGHATVYIHIDESRLITDPVLSDRVLHLRRNGPSGNDWITRVPVPDLILISHLHLDHMHVPSLRQFPDGVPLVVPRDTAKIVRRVLKRPLIEMGPGESLDHGNVRITATYAEHGGRFPLDRAQGYLVQGTRTLYYPGDTDLFSGMADLGQTGIDLAFLPVWGWGPTLGNGHLDPQRAAQALQLLRPKFSIPIHWGVFRPLGPFWDRMAYMFSPGPAFERYAADYAPDTRVVIVPPGDSYHLE